MHARTHALPNGTCMHGRDPAAHWPDMARPSVYSDWDDKNRAQVQGPRGIAKACGWTGAYLLKGSSKSFPQDKHESSEVDSFTDHATHKNK